jgi:hypothetical protein
MAIKFFIFRRGIYEHAAPGSIGEGPARIWRSPNIQLFLHRMLVRFYDPRARLRTQQ